MHTKCPIQLGTRWRTSKEKGERKKGLVLNSIIVQRDQLQPTTFSKNSVCPTSLIYVRNAATATAPRTTDAALAKNEGAALSVSVGLLVLVGVPVILLPGGWVGLPGGVVVFPGLPGLPTVVGGFGPVGPSGSICPPDGEPGTTVLALAAAALYLARVLSLSFGGLMTPTIPSEQWLGAPQ